MVWAFVFMFGARYWRRALDQSLAPHGLTEAAWLPLLFLARVGPVRQGDLAERPPGRREQVGARLGQ